MNRIFQNFALTLLVSIATVGNLRAQALLEDHTDIAFSYSIANGIWEGEFRHGGTDDNPNTSTPLDLASLPALDSPAPAGNRYIQPTSSSFDFTGVPDGEPFWIFPLSNSGYNYTWPGFRNDQTPGTFRPYDPGDPRLSPGLFPWIRIRLVEMSYVGTSLNPQFSLYQFQGGPLVWMATSGDIDEGDVYYLEQNSHRHLNFAFSSLGLYRIAFQPSAILDATGEIVEGTPQWVAFAIGTKAAWTASHYSGEDLFQDSVSGDMSDSDKDGIRLLLEYAFNMNPVLADVKTLEPGTGTTGLPDIRLIPDGEHSALQIEYIRRKVDTNPQISYFAEFKDDLGPGGWTVQTEETVSSIDDVWERVVVNDTVDTSSSGERFGRVRVEVQETISY